MLHALSIFRLNSLSVKPAIMKRAIQTAVFLLAIIYSVQTRAQDLPRFQPTHQEMIERYKRAGRIDSLTKNAVFKSNIEAHWATDGESFWYCNILKDSIREYFRVGACTGKKEQINTAPVETVTTVTDRRQRDGRFSNFRNGAVSPDKKWEAYVEKGNLFIKPANGGTAVQFTTDGSETVPYGAMA
jgi:hypothetical protein